MRYDGAAVRKLVTIMMCSAPLAAGAQQASPATVSGVSAYDALIEGMACRQQKSGRLDCEFRAGNSMRFVVAGVGQEDVAIIHLQADSTSEFVASVVPLHGCVVVKPVRTADSAATFAFVSPKTGKVYRTWSACLSATRPDQRRALSDSVNRATSTKAPVTRRPR